MSVYIAELIGTALLVYLGDGVCANNNLKKTGGHGSGLIVIAFGWAFAVVVPAMIFGPTSGAHFNPALTIALAVGGSLEWSLVPGYILSQMVGGILGGCMVWLQYRDHFNATEDKGAILGSFCTSPAIANPVQNLISEIMGTFMLVFGILGISQTTSMDTSASLSSFGVGGIILVIGVSLGGTTGYAINPARDLGPRIAHAFLPIKHKGDSNWGYAWIPVVGPILGGLIATLLASAIF